MKEVQKKNKGEEENLWGQYVYNFTYFNRASNDYEKKEVKKRDTRVKSIKDNDTEVQVIRKEVDN